MTDTRTIMDLPGGAAWVHQSASIQRPVRRRDRRLALGVTMTTLTLLSIVGFAFGFAEGRDRVGPSPCALGGAQ